MKKTQNKWNQDNSFQNQDSVNDLLVELIKKTEQCPAFPFPDESNHQDYHFMRHDDNAVNHTIIKMMHRFNPEPLRIAAMHYIENHLLSTTHFKGNGYYEKINETPTQYKIMMLLALFNSLSDYQSVNNIIRHMLDNPVKYEPMFLIGVRPQSNSRHLFSFASDEMKKDILNQILKTSKEKFDRETYRIYTGSFIMDELSVIDSSRNPKSAYLPFFVREYSEIQRGDFLDCILEGYKCWNKQAKSINYHQMIIDNFSKIFDFHPRVEKIYNKSCCGFVELADLKSIERQGWALPNDENFQKFLVAKIAKKCKSDNLNFFEEIKKFKKNLKIPEEFIQRYSNFSDV